MQRRRGSLARASASALATADIVEYHPSMSLEAPATHVLLVAPPTTAPPATTPPAPTLETVLATRSALWTRVDALRDALPAYPRESAALQQLQQLHFLIQQRETHLRTLQLAAHRQLKHVTSTSSPPRQDAE